MFDRLHMPSLGGATEWLNSEPLGPAELRGRHVVLVNFWTWTCINWLRQEPYVRAWSQAYRDDGLVVIGVHTPEFSFEYDIEGVRQAVQERAIDYPVAVDNDYAIWSAFANHYWPALYFVDADGVISDQHFGEGRYEQSERVIQRLLEVERELVSVEGVRCGGGGPTGTTWARPRRISGTRAERASRHRDGAAFDQPRAYELPSRLRFNQWALAGEWTIGGEKVVLDQGRREHRLPVPGARCASRICLPGPREPVPFRVAPRRRGSGPLTRRGRRRGRERRARGRPHVPVVREARRGPRADAGDHVPRARRRGVRVHVRERGARRIQETGEADEGPTGATHGPAEQASRADHTEAFGLRTENS